jgi:hypothetical protein
MGLAAQRIDRPRHLYPVVVPDRSGVTFTTRTWATVASATQQETTYRVRRNSSAGVSLSLDAKPTNRTDSPARAARARSPSELVWPSGQRRRSVRSPVAIPEGRSEGHERTGAHERQEVVRINRVAAAWMPLEMVVWTTRVARCPDVADDVAGLDVAEPTEP